ncbi:unnamed protein product [Ceratitis capitata]|uniref:(Mediterranean fruit fly) hypothetical protein n=2 Tax=Ceratitis capitata TaxID=7213 RepID=A0A811ULZ8_CERCA|nr:unnamed protein product [Ceratitis capitata]
MLLKIVTNFVCGELKKVKTNLTMFLIFFWVIWFSQLIAISTMILSLPDITEIPTITVTELPLEILEPTRGNIDALIIDAAKETIAREHENHTLEMLESGSEVIRKDEEIIKFDDSGGAEKMQPTQQTDADLTSNEIPHNIPTVNATNAAISPTPAAPTPATATGTPNENESQATASTAPHTEAPTTGDDNTANTVNLTVEEVPIPVFSEWAQKQMEEAEKQQAKEQEEVNTSTQKKNLTNGDGKRAAPLKMRNKNYASPDCGAKIIASNADASNTGAVLSSSKDEYMLSPCGNRIFNSRRRGPINRSSTELRFTSTSIW